jgi:hypothetical protein
MINIRILPNFWMCTLTRMKKYDHPQIVSEEAATYHKLLVYIKNF